LSTELNLAGLENMTAKLRTLKDVDATPLMLSWMRIGEEDNRRGILAGLDKDGVPMVPVKYRPKPATHLGKPFNQTLRVGMQAKGKGAGSIKATLKQFRLGQKANLRAGRLAGFGAVSAGINNNLSTAEYQLLGGPPLAPRDQFSRVITNYKADYAHLPSGNWATTFFWEDVVDTRGRAFLKYHFEGIGQARRDLRGIRPAGMQKAHEALQNWARTTIHEHFAK
jgi:hypothetical protein